MRIGVLGTGMVGRAIAGKLTELGHDVRVGSRTGGDDKVPFAEAAAHGEVVFNCTAGAGSLDALAQAGSENLAGKLLIDVSNPLQRTDTGLALHVANTDSLAEQIQRTVPEARVVKSLNTVNCNVMVDPESIPGDHVIFVAGDDEDAKAQAEELLGELGWPAERVIDLGDLTGARAMEMYVMLWVRMMGAVGSPQFNITLAR